MIDAKLSCKGHLDYAGENAIKARSSPARMMPNIRGLKSNRWLLIAELLKSIPLYAAPVWAEALDSTVNEKNINLNSGQSHTGCAE